MATLFVLLPDKICAICACMNVTLRKIEMYTKKGTEQLRLLFLESMKVSKYCCHNKEHFTSFYTNLFHTYNKKQKRKKQRIKK